MCIRDSSDTTLSWVTSLVTGWSQEAACNGQLSSTQLVQYGVPHGWVLGPVLFVMYTAQLIDIIARHGLKFNQYVDDCQIYASSPVTSQCCSQRRRAVVALSSRRRGVG